MNKEKELAALKNRRARLREYFSDPCSLIREDINIQRFEELCEINNRIAHLEGHAVLESAREDEIRQILLLGEDDLNIQYPTGNETRQLFGYPPSLGDTAVEYPSHYTSGGIECIDAMKAMLAGYERAKIATKFYWHFLSGQVLKYLWRWPLKERPLQDLKKARWYLDRLITDVENQDHAVTELHSDIGKEISE